MARYGPNGEHLSSERSGDASDQFGRSVAIDALGNVLVAGDFRGTIDLGGGPLTSAGADDVFLAKFADRIFKDGFEV